MSTEQLEKLSTELEIPEGVTVTYKKPIVSVQGPLGKTYKNFKKIPVTIEVVQSTGNKRQKSCNNEYCKIIDQKSL